MPGAVRGIIDSGDEIIYDHQGQPIRLPAERWRHITTRKDHLYMAYMRRETVETLRDPDTITRSLQDPEMVRIYCKWFRNTAVGSKWVLAPVKFLDGGDAFVLTAYALNAVDLGQVIWTREPA